MKTTYKLFGILPTLLFLTAFAAAIAYKLGYYVWPALLGATVIICALCLVQIIAYHSRSVILMDPNFKTSDLEYKSKFELKKLEQHAHMIGASDKAAVIAEYAATRVRIED